MNANLASLKRNRELSTDNYGSLIRHFLRRKVDADNNPTANAIEMAIKGVLRHRSEKKYQTGQLTR